MPITIDNDYYGAAPVQAYGTLEDGRAFYFRARHRIISLEVGPAGHDWDREQGETGVALELSGWSADRHPLSSFDDRHVRPLIEFMADLLGDLEKHDARPPYAQHWRENHG